MGKGVIRVPSLDPAPPPKRDSMDRRLQNQPRDFHGLNGKGGQGRVQEGLNSIMR